MKIRYIYMLLLVGIPCLCFAQVGINTTNPNASLDIQSSNQVAPANTDGVLIPKIDEYPLINPRAAQDGMLVFVTGDGSVTKGFYYWNNATTSWVAFSGATIQRIDDLVDGKSDSDGTQNGSSIFIGLGSGLNDDGSDNRNVGIGYRALRNNTTGRYNIANGYFALNDNTTGDSNVANGYLALAANTTGSNNIANGYFALTNNTTGNFNIANGNLALFNNTIGANNMANGFQSLYNNTTGVHNIANGNLALFNNTIGYYNIANGLQSLTANTEGNNNIASGFQALYNNTTGTHNIANGNRALYNNITGDYNIANGLGALYNTIGSFNIALGYQAGYNETGSNKLYIENSSSASPLIYGEFDNDLLRINGLVEVVETTDSSLKVKTDDGNSSSLSLLEGADFGFELLYTGADDKLNLWSRNFSGNEAERMTWLKDGRVGVNDTAPNALLDIEVSNPTTPRSVDGILIPRVDTFPTTNPTLAQNGMLVYLNSDSNFYHWHNASTSWRILGGPQGVDDLYDGISEASGSSVYIGLGAGFNNSSNSRNSGFGFNVLSNNTGGFFNSGVGHRSLVSNTTGDSNTSIGFEALENITTGSRNTAIGANSGPTIGVLSNTTAVGYNTVPLFSNSVRIGNASVTSIGGHANWSNVSDKRLKTNIKENIVGLDFIKKLRPVSYNYNMDAIARFEKTPDSLRLKDAEALKSKEIQTGFIAQEVEEAAKDVGFDFHGIDKSKDSNGIYALRYAEFVVPLVKGMQEQQVIIETQQEELKALRKEVEEIKALVKQKK